MGGWGGISEGAWGWTWIRGASVFGFKSDQLPEKVFTACLLASASPPCRSSLPPFIYPPSLPPCRTFRSIRRAQSLRPYTCAATVHDACCSGFCLVAFRLYPQTKKRKLSQESRNPSCLCFCVSAQPQINLRTVHVQGSQPDPELNHHKPQPLFPPPQIQQFLCRINQISL